MAVKLVSHIGKLRNKILRVYRTETTKLIQWATHMRLMIITYKSWHVVNYSLEDLSVGVVGPFLILLSFLLHLVFLDTPFTRNYKRLLSFEWIIWKARIMWNILLLKRAYLLYLTYGIFYESILISFFFELMVFVRNIYFYIKHPCKIFI